MQSWNQRSWDFHCTARLQIWD